MNKPYTEKDIEYMKNNCQTQTIKEISEAINHPYKSVQKKLQQLGLKPYKKFHSKKWSENEINILKKKYRKTDTSVLALELGRTENSIELKANSLGLYKRKWTKEEEEYLAKKYVNTSNKTLAKRTNRSVHSVKHKLENLNFQKRNENMYIRTIANCFNSDSRVIQRWIKKFGLPCKKSHLGYIIDTKDFWKWAENNKDIIPFYKYELYSILPQPVWVESETKKICYTRNNRKKITDYERNYIYNQKKKGKSYEQISKDLSRSVHSVRHIYVDENKKRREYQNE